MSDHVYMSPTTRLSRIPLPTEIWRHEKTERLYRIEHLAREEVTGQTLVVYRESSGARPKVDVPGTLLWVRPIGVFLWNDDGSPRFTPYGDR